MQKYIYIYGINPVKETLRSGNFKINQLYCSKKLKDEEVNSLAKAQKVKITYLDDKDLLKFTNQVNNQHVVAEILEPKYLTVEELIENTRHKSNSVILVVDQIHDPHNLGAIIRSADLFGVDGIILLNKRQVGITGVVAKSSAGAINYVPICYVNNLTNAVEKLKKENYWIYATNLNSTSTSINNVDFRGKVVLIIGNEGKGVSQKLTNHADYNVHIPTSGHVDSLNVSVACGILLYQVSQSQLKGE